MQNHELGNNAETNKMLATFGMTYLNSWSYMEKHLNRQRKVRMGIPIWKDGRFVEQSIMWIEQAPKGKVYEVPLTYKDNHHIRVKFEYKYNIVDKQLGQSMSMGFATSRKELTEKYLKLMNDSYSYYNVMMGKGL